MNDCHVRDFLEKCRNHTVSNCIFSAEIRKYDHHSSSVVDHFDAAGGITRPNNTTAHCQRTFNLTILYLLTFVSHLNFKDNCTTFHDCVYKDTPNVDIFKVME